LNDIYVKRINPLNISQDTVRVYAKLLFFGENYDNSRHNGGYGDNHVSIKKMGTDDYTFGGKPVELPAANMMQIQIKSGGNFSYTSRVRTPLITNV
jgi:hypothetical protein